MFQSKAKTAFLANVFFLMLVDYSIEGLSSSPLPSSPEIQYINGRRCLLSPAIGRNKASDSPSSTPLILIGGTAQTITSWEHHVQSLSRNRDVLVYECLGQGPCPPHLDVQSNPDALESYLSDVSLQRQANDLNSIISKTFPLASHVDIAGFSFGGRVAMATAATYPKLVRKLHITGVPATRTPLARLILTSWESLLQSSKQNRGLHSKNADLLPFAWSSIMSTYSPSFLSQNEQRVPQWVEFLSRQNTLDGILALLEQTHTEDEQDEWHPISMANRVIMSDSMPEVQMAVGSLDCMATIEETMRLNELFQGKAIGNAIHVYEGCGHAVMMEDARRWRNDLIKFLDN